MARFNLDEYETVEARLKRFWAEHPAGAVHSEIVAITPDQKNVVVRAQVFFNRADPMPAGMGLAQETAGGGGANSTSWVENCDTSAVGRALANCGYSGDKRASREEMAKVNQGAPALTQAERPPMTQNTQTTQNAQARDAGRPERAHNAQSPQNAPLACSQCGKALTRAQRELSMRGYGQPLCPVHQRDAGRVAA